MIIRRRRTRNFTTIDNGVFDDQELSPEALGVLSYLLSRPNNWEVQPDHLRSRFDIGRDKLQKIMRLLRERGYARIEYEHDKATGTFRNCGYVICDEPVMIKTVQPVGEVASDAVAEAIETADLTNESDVHRVPENPAHGETVSRENRLTVKPSAGKSGSKEETKTEIKQNPHTPKGDLGEGSSIDLEEIPSKTASARFERLREAWPADPTINWERVESGFYRMPVEDQENASKIAKRYVEFCRREGRKLKAPQNWLRDKGWAGFLEEERKASAAVERGRTMVWVMEGTRAWDAWRGWYEAKGKVPKVAMQVKAEKGFGNYFPTLFPSAAE
ncbi:hypothetical protein [Microvirga vignae]|uniref:hypothetical protein n=1 Tax=Microvirga vignae TaxID=1225564 RepID=UPI00069C5BA1|nr:hypothetical protein [Microvirga vignae]